MYKTNTLLAALMLTATSLVQAETYTVTQLTNNNVNEGRVQFNAQGDFTWTTTDGVDYEVYLFDNASQSTIKITNNDRAEGQARINNRQDLAWVSYVFDQVSFSYIYDVVFRDGASGVTTTLVQGKKSVGSVFLNNSGEVLWEHRDDGAMFSQLYKWNPVSGEIKNITNGFTGFSNIRFNDRGDVVWFGSDGNDFEIFLYSAAQDSYTNISNNDFYDSFWFLSFNNNSDIAWTVYTDVDTHTMRYDGATGTVKQLTVDNGLWDTNPWLGLNGDVTWQAENNIMLYDAATGEVRQLTNDALPRTWGVLDARGDVIWTAQDPNGTDSEIYFYDRAADTITAITDNDVDDGYGWVNSHGDIAYISGADTAAEVMFYSNTTKKTTRITNDVLRDANVTLTDNLNLIWHQYDGDSELMLAQITTTTPLDFTYARATQSVEDGDIKLVINSALGLPAADDVVTVVVDGLTVLTTPFSAFMPSSTPGKYKYRSLGIEASLNLNAGSFKLEIGSTIAGSIDTSDGVDMTIMIGNAVGSGHTDITPVD